MENKELAFGSEEWISELERRVKFPKMFAFYYGVHQESNEGMLHAKMLETKATEPKNIKYGTISPTLTMLLSSYNWLNEGVYYIRSADEYLMKMQELAKRWNVKFND